MKLNFRRYFFFVYVNVTFSNEEGLKKSLVRVLLVLS